MKKIFAVLLCFCLLLPGAVAPVCAAHTPAVCEAKAASGFLQALETLLDRLARAFRLPAVSPAAILETAYPKAKTQAKTLLLLNCPTGDAALALGSLQGVLANRSDVQLLFKDGCWQAATAVLTDVQTIDRGAPDVPALLAEFADIPAGYVLTDEIGAQAAVSVAGVLQAVVIPASLRYAAENAGLKLLEDTRGWTDQTLRLSKYFCRLSRSVAFSQPVSLAPKLVDYAVMAGAYFGFSDSKKDADCRRTYAFLGDNAVVFGWNPVLGEYGTVSALSKINACLVPADHAANLSVYSGLSSAELEQIQSEPQPASARCHTVCIVMTDGDNLQWMLTGFTDTAHYGSPLRGGFSMGWGVPASLFSAAPGMAARLYETQTPADEFVLQISGLGYTYPSQWRNPFALRRMYAALSQQMRTADLHVAAVLDDGGFGSCALDALAAQANVSGVFYLDFAKYAGTNGALRFSHGKPLIGARYQLWSGIPGCSPEEIAAAVNAASTDPADPASYSLIAAHAWSGLDGEGNFGGYGDTMAAVAALVNALGPGVQVVSPSEFVSRIGALTSR